MRTICSLRQHQVALTGICARPRHELVSMILKAGGIVTGDGRMTAHTTLLVRGSSVKWKYGDFGKKEAAAAAHLRNGGELSVVLDDDFEQLLTRRVRRIGECPFVAGYRVEDLRAEAVAAELDSAELATPGQLDRLGVSRRRGEQAVLRAQLLQRRQIAPCSLCGRTLPAFLIVAAHIKPRARCSPREKRDLRNVAMLLCSLGCDALFEHGLVAVDPRGRVVISSKLGRARGAYDVVSRLRRRRCPAHSAHTEQYFAWHRNHRFS